METSGNNTMYITYVEKHGAFLKIWGQIDKACPITIENYLADLKPQFDQGHYTLSSPTIQVGLMCCAKYRDDLYYRARVTNISALCQNFVEVHFVDYGNKDILPISSLRSGVELSYVLVTIPVQARDFILANVTHVGASWESRTIAAISEEIRYMNLQFTVVQQINPYLTIIKLFKSGEDYALSLFNRGFVLCMSSATQNMILQSINSTPAHLIHPPISHQSPPSITTPPLPPGLQTHQMALPVASPPQPSLQSTATLLTYKGHTINPGTEHNVYVSYVSDGPCHFSVQLQKLEENLAKLMRELNRMELEPLEEHPLPGTVCLAKCVEDDNICRAVITSMSNDEAKVFYVDFGNTEVVANERLFQIPLKFVVMKVMSTRYSLAGLENTTVTLEMKCAFKEFVSDKLLMMHSLAPPAKYALPLCILWDNNKNNALDVMKKIALLAYPEVISITRGFCQEVIVSYVYSCSHFYVQLKSKEEELRKLMEELQIVCPNAQTMNLSLVKEGLPCCALFDTDGQWYRGEIISNEGDTVKVRYVDYGNEELVQVSNLRVPMGDIVTALRPQALECCLNGYQNMTDDVERDTILEELILEKEFTMRVIEMQSSRALVDLIDNARYNVGSLLLERLALAHSQASPLLIQDSYQIEQRKRQSPNAVNNKYERKNSRDTINEDEPDRGISRKNLNNQRNNDSRNREMFRQDSNKIESKNKQDDWNNGESSPDYNKKQESWRQDRPPRREKNESGGGWNAKSDEWNGTTEDRWGNNKRQDSWRQSKPRRDENVQSDEWNSTKQERPQWGNNTKQESWRQERSPRGKRDETNSDRGATNDEWGDATQDRSDWGNKKQDSWQQDKPRRRDRDDGSDGGSDRFKNDGFKKEWRGGGGGDRDFNKNKRDSYKKEGWGDNTDNSERGGGRNYNQGRKNNFKQDSWGDNASDVTQKSPNEKEGSGNWEGRKRNDFGKPYKSEWKSEKIMKKVEDPADSTAVYSHSEVSGKCEEVVISWFRDPSYFYCQLKQSQEEFRKLVEDIQLWYCKIGNESLPVGTAAIAQYSDDKVLYRAYISEMRGSQYYVYFVDFGNFALADKVWPIEKKFMTLPGQALYCSLNGLMSIEENGVWPESSSFASYFDKESFMCTFVSSENNGHYVELVHDNQSISETLVQAGLAKYVESEIFDPSILCGQQIHVTLDDIQGLDSFNVTLPNGVQVVCTLHNLQNATETFEDTLKQYLGFIVIMYVDNVLEEKTEVTLYDISGVKINIIEPDEEAFPSVEVLCPLPVLSSTVCGWVSFVVANEKKLFIQPTEHSETVTNLLDTLFNHYDTTTLEEPLKPEVGQYYAVHSTDGNWYRGAVLSVEDDNATLLYIDYGNSETVSNSELRDLTQEFKELHMLALEVTSANIDESFVEQEVTATVWYGESCWEAEIQKASDTTEIVAVVAETENVESVVQDVETNEAQLDQVSQPVEEPNALGVPVCLSHADSPNEFYLQLYEAVETIENLQATLQEEVEGYADLENPGAGILCAAQYSVDQQWYRAQILDADGEITSIRFVDYGNTDAITTHIKTLPPDMLALEQYARRCSLLIKPIDEEEWNTTGCERFEALTQTEMLSVEIIHQDEKTTYVQLYADGQDVAEILLQEGLAVKLELEVESSCTGYISNLNSPSEFWIQLENSVADLEWIAEQLMSATNFPELEDLTPGSLCAALYTDDEMWYRARILSNTIAGIEVLFIDYGNSCTCIGLRQLPEDLIMLAPLAQKCSLQKPPGILQWSSQATDEFKNISADGVTVFNIDKLSTGETLIVRLLLNSEDVSEKLLPITESAYITHVDSTHAFWLQKVADGSKSDEIAENLANASEFPMCETVEVGDIVAALQVDDGMWYRAQILNINENEYEVLFIDYGNTSVTSDIRTLSDNLKHSPLATKHKMEALPGFRWMDDEATEKLVEISNESSTVFEAEFANENVVRLYLDGYDIRSLMDTVCISSVQSSPKKGVAASTIDASKIVRNLENYESANMQKDAVELMECDILNSKIENVDNSEEPENLEIDTENESSKTLVRRSSTPFSERIVPGSISRGDLTEMDDEDNIKGAGSPESRSSTPECDKTVLREESPKLSDNDSTLTLEENSSSKESPKLSDNDSTPEKVCPTLEENSSSKESPKLKDNDSTPEKVCPTLEENSSSKESPKLSDNDSTPEKVCPTLKENSSGKDSPKLSDNDSTPEKVCPTLEENSSSKDSPKLSDNDSTPEKACPAVEENSSSTTVFPEQPAITESNDIVPIVSSTSDEQLANTDEISSSTLDENTAPKYDDETKSDNKDSIENNKIDSTEFEIDTNKENASGDIASKIDRVDNEDKVLPSEKREDRDESIDKLDCIDISKSGDAELNS
ncbi:hypothetical protein RI129_005398 [Pyrocoelia pectoralis]|uniref:Tudor domain-containing protein n=1 Tax=Pyrocoelia pectoralis TaxID=417401 RepID=A0AAN7VMM7_9COLE